MMSFSAGTSCVTGVANCADSILLPQMALVLLNRVPITNCKRHLKKNNSGKKNKANMWSLCNGQPDLTIFANHLF